MSLNNIPSGDDIPGRELLKHYPRQGSNIHSIKLNQIPRLVCSIFLGLSCGIRPLNPSPMGRDMIL